MQIIIVNYLMLVHPDSTSSGKHNTGDSNLASHSGCGKYDLSQLREVRLSYSNPKRILEMQASVLGASRPLTAIPLLCAYYKLL